MVAAAAAATGTVLHDGGALQLTPLSEWRDARKRARGDGAAERAAAPDAKRGRAAPEGSTPEGAPAAGESGAAPEFTEGLVVRLAPVPASAAWGTIKARFQGFGPVEFVELRREEPALAGRRPAEPAEPAAAESPPPKPRPRRSPPPAAAAAEPAAEPRPRRSPPPSPRPRRSPPPARRGRAHRRRRRARGD